MLQKLISEVRKKTRQNRKKNKRCTSCRKAQNVHTENKKSKYTHTIKQSYRILEITVVCQTNEMLLKFIVGNLFYVGGVS